MRPICLTGIAVALLSALLACSPQISPGSADSSTNENQIPQTGSTPTVPLSPTPQPESLPKSPPPKIGAFTTDQLFDSGGGGCGMSLWKPEQADQRVSIFFNGMEPDTMLMMIDGEMVKFSRTTASGAVFYGQQTSQTFVSPDAKIQVNVDVQLGTEGEIESVSIPAGTLQVKRDGQRVEVSVVGDAGC